jgi:serine/threonine protein kinase/tetratricopeptide (TPR) repeat protein
MDNTSASLESALDNLISQWQRRRSEGQEMTPAELCRDCPELLPELQKRIAVLKRMADLADATHQTVTLDTAGGQDGISTPEGWPNIPGYEILGELGRGGMGVVYKARQINLNRIVALKMILAGSHAGREAIARFLREAETIARLRHPHVVQVHEFGSHEGKPFFSLEYLEGGSLTDKLRGEPQPSTQAAQTVEVLARAVGAAHAQGVVHRDLKPANVLLTADGSAKLTDFGLAKQADSGMTATGQVLGTPSYMAPEQAGGDSKGIGPAADIYALGAILYELLTGRPPFKGASAWDTLQMVVGTEPVAVRQLQPKVPRDLETICLKCLHKDPARRYDSALALAEDLHRFLDDEPIHARPIGAPERLMRWARRSPRVATLSAAVIVLVLLLLIGSLVATARIAQSRDDERRERENAENLARSYELLAEKERLTAESAKNAASLLANLFEASDPVGLQSGTSSTRRSPDERRALLDMLDNKLREIRQKFSREPALLALLVDAIGNAYRSLGQYDRAKPLLDESLALRRERAREAPLDLAESLHHLARWHHEKGDYEVAEQMYQETLDLRVQALQTEEHLLVAASKLALAWLLTEAGESEKPERLLREVIETRRRLQGPDHREVAIAEIGLAAFFIDRQRVAEAVPLVLAAAKIMFTHGEFGKLGEAVVQFQLGIRFREAGGYTFAESALRRSLELTRQALGEQHIYVALVLHELGDTLEKRDNLAAAERIYRECLEMATNQVGLTHPKSVFPIASLARVLAKEGRRSEAEQLFLKLREANETRYGKQNVRVATALTAYAAFLDDRGETARSAAVRQEADDLFRKAQGTSNRFFALNLSSWASSCCALKQYPQAERLSREALPLLERHFGRDSLVVVNLLDTLSLSLIHQKRFTEAEPFCDQALKLIQRHPSARWTVLDTVGRLHQGKGQLAEAEKYYRDALALARKEHRNRLGDLAYSLKNLADVLIQRGEHRQAEPLLAEAQRLRNQRK